MKMRFKLLQSGLSAIFGLTQITAATLNDWSSRQTINITEPGLIRVEVPLATFDAAQASLADLRLLDPAGAEVPCLIMERPRSVTRTLRPQEGWQVFLEENRTRIEIDLNLRGQLTALSLETPATDFLKAASLSGVAEGSSRALITGYPVFRQRAGTAQLRLKVPEGGWKHLTLVLDDARSKPIPITGLVLHEQESAVDVPESAPATLGERIEGIGETRLTLDLGGARAPLAGLRFQTEEPLFIRRVNVLTRQWENGEVRERSLGAGTIYRVAVEGQSTAAQLDLPLDAQSPTREVVLVIDNGDSPPLPVSAVTALVRPTRLVFLARQSGPFQLFSGNPRAAPPRYDLAVLSSQLKAAKFTSIKPVSLAANPDFRPSEPLPEIPLFAAALSVEGWTFRRAVKLASGPVQQLELTPHVLAHAQAGLGDLRLVAAGKQVPFILEGGAFTRALDPVVARADDPKSPRASRWSIRLPQPHLPVTRLYCESKAALFQREARVIEELADSRGEVYSRTLGVASWVRQPGEKSRRFSVDLAETPRTQNLLLVIDNGDNAALDLEKFQVSMPVRHLLFKAPPGVAIDLCYGNGKAAAPTYDLGLVAPQLLAAAKTDATLADTDPAGPAAVGTSSKNLSFIFFGVLALVVGALVVVIARLLPKPG